MVKASYPCKRPETSKMVRRDALLFFACLSLKDDAKFPGLS